MPSSGGCLPTAVGCTGSCQVRPHLREDDAVPLPIIHQVLGAAGGVCQQPGLGGQPHVALCSVHLPCTPHLTSCEKVDSAA